MQHQDERSVGEEVQNLHPSAVAGCELAKKLRRWLYPGRVKPSIKNSTGPTTPA